MPNYELASQRIPWLSQGHHEPDGAACALEYLSIADGIPWTDRPTELRTWDIRPINDIKVSDELRTESLLPVAKAYHHCMDWPRHRQRAVSNQLVILTVQRILADFGHLQEHIRNQCRTAGTSRDARKVARSIGRVPTFGYKPDEQATWAAWAARAAAVVACTLTEAPRNHLFEITCQVWMDALNETSVSANTVWRVPL